MPLQTKTFSYGDFTYGGISNGYMLDLIITEDSISEVDNTSTVSYRLQLRSGKSNRFKTSSFGCSVDIGNTHKDSTVAIDAYYNHTYELVSGKVIVPHDPDGKKSLFVKGNTDAKPGNKYAPPAMEVSGSVQLANIPRVSGVKSTDAYVESVASISIASGSKDFTHSIKYTFGSLSGYIDGSGNVVQSESKFSQTTIPFTIPNSFYSQIPNSRYGVCKLICKTYNGNTFIGESQANFNVMTLESRCRPTISGSVVDVNDKAISLTGNSDILIKYVSTARCTASAVPNKGSTIKSISVNGVSAIGGSADLPEVETSEFRFSVTDSRDYGSTYKVEKEIVPYIPVTAVVTVRRPSPTGSEAIISVAGDFFNGSFGKETNKVKIAYDVYGAGSGEIDAVVEGNTYSAETTVSGVPYNQSYNVTVTVSDSVGSVVRTDKINRGLPVFNFGADYFDFHVPVDFGKGIGSAEISLVGQSNEKEFEAQLDNLLSDMPDGSIIPIRFLVQPFVTGYTAYGMLFKHDGQSAALKAFNYWNQEYYKYKENGDWKPACSSSASGVAINDASISRESVWSSQKTQEILADAIPEGVATVESGSEISSDIVSSFNHSVECKVSRINLLDSTKPIGGFQTNGTPTATGYRVKGNWYANLFIRDLTPGTKYFLSYTSEIITGSVNRVVIKDKDTNGTELVRYSNGTGGELTPISDTICIMFYVGDGSAGEVDYKNLILSAGEKPYVPYIPNLSALQVTQTGTGVTSPRVFPVGEDGAVSGIQSISPQMSIKLANSGAVLDVKYYKDTKKYIDRKFAQIRADIDYVAVMQGVTL